MACVRGPADEAESEEMARHREEDAEAERLSRERENRVGGGDDDDDNDDSAALELKLVVLSCVGHK